MKIHTLQSVWPASSDAMTRHLSEGGRLDQDPPGPLTLETEEVFCNDNRLNSWLSKLHQLARMGYGQNIQVFIDSYLPAVAFLRNETTPELKAFARRMVLCTSDSPQEGTLPDLGRVLRGILLGYKVSGSWSGAKKGVKSPVCDFPFVLSDDCYITHMMLQALPCIKRSIRKDNRGMSGYQVGLNVLMGLLLGLCPLAIKFPPFPVRVTI